MKIIALLLYMQTAAAIEYAEYNEADLPNPAEAIQRDEAGNIVEVTINRWQDRVKTAEGDKLYEYRQGYNYQKKQGFIRTFTLQGDLVHEEYARRIDGMVSREEMLKAFELFKADPFQQTLMAAEEQAIVLHGGFNFEDDEEGEPCFKGNRCVHVFASTPKTTVVAHAIVRLTDNSIPYPTFDTDDVTKAKFKQFHEKRGAQ